MSKIKDTLTFCKEGRATNTYRRFMATPVILSLIFSIVLGAAVFVAFLNLGHWLWTILGVVVAFTVADFAAWASLRVMIRRRVWGWCGSKFETWEEASKWISSTPPSELDIMAGRPTLE